MLKRALVFACLFLVGILYFDSKGWIQITPDGKKVALVLVQKGKAFTKALIEVVRGIVDEAESQ